MSENITPDDIDQWAGSVPAEDELVDLVSMLVNATNNHLMTADFPGGKGANLGGPDGLTETLAESLNVPAGRALWELGTEKGPGTKATEDYDYRVEHTPLLERQTMAFVAVTGHHWKNRDQWVKTQNAKGDWRLVRALDASGLTRWLEQAPGVAAHFAKTLRGKAQDAENIQNWWNLYASETFPKLSLECVLAGRKLPAEQLLRRIVTLQPGEPYRLRPAMSCQVV